MNAAAAKNIISALGIIEQISVVYSDVLDIAPAGRSTRVRLSTPYGDVIDCRISKRGLVTGVIGGQKVRSMHPVITALTIRCVLPGWSMWQAR
jgi:hypothetical protein